MEMSFVNDLPSKEKKNNNWGSGFREDISTFI